MTVYCCACGQPCPDTTYTLVELPHPAPEGALGWSCAHCDLARPGAVALVCSSCRVAHTPIRFALGGPSIYDQASVPVKELDGDLAHNWERHGLQRPGTVPPAPQINRSTVTGDDPAAMAIVPDAAAFDGKALMEAHHLKAIGDGLIAAHDTLRFLARHQIRYLWRAEGRRRDGELELGDVAIAREHLRFYTGAEAVIEMAADGCRDQTCLYLEAALCHVLMHLTEKDNGDLKRQDHDFSGFYSEAQIYGAWRRDLRQAYEVMAQLSLAL